MAGEPLDLTRPGPPMTLMVIDGNNLAMRSFHAARGQMSSRGEDTGGLQLFINSLSKHVREIKPDRLVVCWDKGRSEYRLRIHPEYKIHRNIPVTDPVQPQEHLFHLIRSFLFLAQVPQWGLRGIEADDLIASVWRGRLPGERVVILSSDKDLLQLLDDHTEQIRFSSASAPTDRWTKQRIIDELGYRPDQIPLLMALTGDRSDGVPGVPGVGPKKAVKALQAAGWDPHQLMLDHPEWYSDFQRSRQLVDLLNVELVPPPVLIPFEPTVSGSPGWADLLSFCDHYELRTIRDRLESGSLWANRKSPLFETVNADTP